MGARTLEPITDVHGPYPPDMRIINPYSVATPIIPTDIAGCDLWLRADGITGLSDGNAVATWPDNSGNGNDFAQGTPANRPTYETGEINGKPVVRFVASSGHQLTSAMVSGFPCTLFVVLKPRAVLSGYVGAVSLDDGQLLLANLGGDNKWGTYTSGNDAAGSQLVNGTAYVACIVSTGSFFLNGVADGTYGGGSSDQGSVIGGIGGQSFEGDIAEVILYDSALSGTDRAAVEDYLMNKYAL
jgi:hypothetical protein